MYIGISFVQCTRCLIPVLPDAYNDFSANFFSLRASSTGSNICMKRDLPPPSILFVTNSRIVRYMRNS